MLLYCLNESVELEGFVEEKERKKEGGVGEKGRSKWDEGRKEGGGVSKGWKFQNRRKEGKRWIDVRKKEWRN